MFNFILPAVIGNEPGTDGVEVRTLPLCFRCLLRVEQAKLFDHFLPLEKLFFNKKFP